MDAWTPWLFGGFPVFFGALWLTIFAVVSRWGGWRELAQVYPARGTASGERFRWRSAQLRAGCNYNNCLTFVSGPAGLQLSLPFVFSFRHPPLFFPWSELRAREETVWRIPVVVLEAARCSHIPIKLHRGLAERLLAPTGSALLQGGG
ncbi:MAG: hypothetical protein MJE66_08030 [Proteobacteria bacterium]|nr:hypothetical protein [Pseudomonadota bacterium]